MVNPLHLPDHLLTVLLLLLVFLQPIRSTILVLQRGCENCAVLAKSYASKSYDFKTRRGGITVKHTYNLSSNVVHELPSKIPTETSFAQI